MPIDVIDLRDFYSQRLGVVARRLINRGIHARWPDAAGQRVLGLGYPTPYLGLFREDSERCIAFMPAAFCTRGASSRRGCGGGYESPATRSAGLQKLERPLQLTVGSQVFEMSTVHVCGRARPRIELAAGDRLFRDPLGDGG